METSNSNSIKLIIPKEKFSFIWIELEKVLGRIHKCFLLLKSGRFQRAKKETILWFLYYPLKSNLNLS